MITDRIGLHSVLLPLLIWIMKTVLNNVSPTQVLFPSLQKIDDEKLKKNLVFLFIFHLHSLIFLFMIFSFLFYLPSCDLLISFFFIAWSDCGSLGAMESIMFLDYRFLQITDFLGSECFVSFINLILGNPRNPPRKFPHHFSRFRNCQNLF